MTTLAKPQGCTNLRLRRLSRLVSRHYDAHVAASGLKTTQYSLLSHVVQLGPLRPVDLARAMNVEASTLTRNLKPMVAAGWLTQGEGPDARSRMIAVTDAGRAKRAEAQAHWRDAQLGLNDLLGVERVLALHALLDESLEVLQRAGLAEDQGASHE
ncbi:MarR family winged helix-turn-helix transcriptional regulator [Variovorax sp. J22G21]|uniref:MarR family winged helix-turn-helix transcriptional regulator n=1 Tax=Variovorax fucosicus TaxID=3053517 RepID=UPI002576E062|nr:MULTISPECIES: MarR family winged helix-turn-helix transcriptional regulator [unclassified Variovorax]MDM0040818.1 MarR family winged helix-turn-helix transcriptional regulator [Variovorax sp. J22R193]MDM0064774.1 MarR family winged helix-turn-helix transcriptional regulator [Variovorax sp. J22G21]